MGTPAPVPITIITGFVGSGKTTLLLSLIPQLHALDPSYRLGLVKNEIGDLAIDTALASSPLLSSAQELLGSCICCTNVGQIGPAFDELLSAEPRPDRIIVETSGSAEPIKLVVEINRLAQGEGKVVLDGVVSVVDVLNWEGYSSSSFTAKLQAKQTDLIVLNKWEDAGEDRLDRCLDRLGDLDVDTPVVKSQQGRIDVGLLFGLDGKMVKGLFDVDTAANDHTHDHGENEGHHHQDELECLSITVDSTDSAQLDLIKLDALLRKAPKDEVYRIKAILYSRTAPVGAQQAACDGPQRYILNWSFGRHTWTSDGTAHHSGPIFRASLFLAPYESTKWTKRLESGEYISTLGNAEYGNVTVTRTL